MNATDFFRSQVDKSFKNYLKLTHANWSKDTLSSLRAILNDYVADVKDQQHKNPKTARLKTVYKDAELRELLKNVSESSRSEAYYITGNNIEQLNIDHNQGAISRNTTFIQKRSRETTPTSSSSAQPSSPTGIKRNRRSTTSEDFVSSELITDSDNNSDGNSSPSSFFPSDLMTTPVGYTCRIDMCELPDNTCTPLPIPNSHFAAMVDSSIKKSDESQLFPTDCDARLYASSIFSADGPFLNNTGSDILSEHVYQNIRVFTQAIQRRTLYLPPHGYTTLNEMALDNVIRSTYLLHGKPRINTKQSELSQVALSVSTFLSPLFSAHDPVQVEFDSTSWIFKQENAKANEVESLRPDVIFYHEHQGMVMEVGCGEVKKPGVSQALLKEDKMRVLEVMKRQLHLRLFHAKKKYEAVTFGILVQGTNVILLKMEMDLEDGVYMYHEEYPFTIPTTYDTHTHMAIALEAINSFKDQMFKSLPKEEDQHCQGIWDQYKFHVRPTVSHFEPIYHD
ncbi:hypothetical protein INT47_003772 [Mucor saturninus]|uniref:Uncharacterized protein n=1 Tax=Mucor saturninus TaxID=64648 RepID=A0A8H7V7D3_9FUNG|nr:hypothetical protein INT47_003772 [Mucor saturninus]